MTKTFKILNIGTLDSQGDIFMPGSIKLPEDKNIPVLDDFDASKKLGDVVSIEEIGKELFCTANIIVDPKGLIPAIGFKPVSKRATDGVNEYSEVELFAVGLCRLPNVDTSIKPLE